MDLNVTGRFQFEPARLLSPDALVQTQNLSISGTGGNSTPFEVGFEGAWSIQWATLDECPLYMLSVVAAEDLAVRRALFRSEGVASGSNLLYAMPLGTYFVHARTFAGCEWRMQLHPANPTEVHPSLNGSIPLSGSDGNSAPINVPFGPVWRIDWATSGDCTYYPELREVDSAQTFIPDGYVTSEYMFSVEGRGSGVNYLYHQSPGRYYIAPVTNPNCHWTMTISDATTEVLDVAKLSGARVANIVGDSGNTGPFTLPSGTWNVEWTTIDDCYYFAGVVDVETGRVVSPAPLFKNTGQNTGRHSRSDQPNRVVFIRSETYYVDSTTRRGPCRWRDSNLDYLNEIWRFREFRIRLWTKSLLVPASPGTAKKAASATKSRWRCSMRMASACKQEEGTQRLTSRARLRTSTGMHARSAGRRPDLATPHST